MTYIYDPTGSVDAQPKPMAPRVSSLRGARLGVLDNTKWNAGKLLRAAAEIVRAEAGIGEVRFYAKESFSRPADPVLLEKIADENDVVLTAIGD